MNNKLKEMKFIKLVALRNRFLEQNEKISSLILEEMKRRKEWGEWEKHLNSK